jgi:beta-phosphoglucomutase
MLQGVIFDMDGVIIDSHPAHREAWKTFLRTLDKTVSDTELDFVLDGRKRSEILRHFLGELSDSEVLELGNRKDELFRKAALQVKPIPGVIELIDGLRGARIATAVATSASESRTRSTLDSLGLADKFDVLVTGDDVTLGKPDPSVYRLACRRLSIAPSDTLAIEDAESGIQAANGAAISCIGVAVHRSREKLLAAGAAHVVEDFIGLSVAELDALLPGHHRHPISRALITGAQ